MKKALKITGIAIGVVILVLILLAAVLPFLINPNHYKDQIAKAVKDKTGRELNIEGDIKLSIFPWLGVQIGPMELSNAPGFSGAPFAAINESDVHVRFWPLLHGGIQVGEVKLDGLTLDLQRNAEGRTNWQDIEEKLARGSSASGSGSSSSGSGTNLSVAGVSVSNSQVRWTDAQKHQQYTISDFTLKLGAFAPAEPVSLKTGFDFAATNPALQGHADFDGTLVADLDHKIYSADGAKLELQAKGDTIPGGETQADLQWKHAVANLDAGSVALNGFDLSAYGLTLHLEAQGKDIQKDPSFAGSVKLDAFSPRDVLKALGHPDVVNTRDAGALKRASAAFGFGATASSASASDIDFTLDDTHLTGKAGIKDFKTQALSFDLDVDKLDADRYLPPPQTGTTNPREQTDVNKVGLPLRTLRGLNLDGHLHVGEFGLLNTKTTDFDMQVTAHDGLIHISPLSAALYGGSLNGDLQVDARVANADQPLVNETLNLKGVQVGPLLKDFAKVDRLSGTLELGSSTRAQGRMVGELRSTLNGKMNFAVKNGALEGVNVWDSIARGYATLKGQPAPPPAPARTEFADLHGTGTIARGVLTNKDLTALLPFMTVTGAGKLDLAELTVDYEVKGRVTGSPNLGSRQDLSGLKGTVVPIHITGTLSNLSVRPDLGGIVKGKVQEQLNKKKTDLKKKAKDKLQQLLQGGGGG